MKLKFPVAWSGRREEKRPSRGTVKVIGTPLPPDGGEQIFEDVHEPTESARCFNILDVNQEDKQRLSKSKF